MMEAVEAMLVEAVVTVVTVAERAAVAPVGSPHLQKLRSKPRLPEVERKFRVCSNHL